MREELHISSLVVRARPDVADAVARQVTELPGAEVHQRVSTGKLIVTLETANTSEIMDRLEAINEMPGVISTALVYHQWEAVSTAESEPDDGSHAPQLPQS